MAPTRKDLTGKRFNRWVVLGYSYTDKFRRSWWVSKCDCGTVRDVVGNYLKSNRTMSCGCYRQEKRREMLKGNTYRMTHGKSNTKLYHTYKHMIERCYSEKNKDYSNYGGRGIKVCEKWLESFENFYNDVIQGYKENLQLDRENNNGNYEPTNCRWVSSSKNQKNRRNSSNTQSLVDLVTYTNSRSCGNKHWLVRYSFKTQDEAEKFALKIEELGIYNGI